MSENKAIEIRTGYGLSLTDSPVDIYESIEGMTIRLKSSPSEILYKSNALYKAKEQLWDLIYVKKAELKERGLSEKESAERLVDVRVKFVRSEKSEVTEQFKKDLIEVISHYEATVKSMTAAYIADLLHEVEESISSLKKELNTI